MWSLNPEYALDEEEAIYERSLQREKNRKRKRRKPISSLFILNSYNRCTKVE